MRDRFVEKWLINPRDAKKTSLKCEVTIDEHTWKRLKFLVSYSPKECGGLLKLLDVKVEDGVVYCRVEDPGDRIILPQVASSAEFGVEDDDIARFITEVRESQMEPHVLWWHSHVYFETRPSARDETTMDAFASCGGCVVTLILNKGGDVFTRLDYNVDGKKYYCNAEVSADAVDAAERAYLIELYEKNVKQGSMWDRDARQLEAAANSGATIGIKGRIARAARAAQEEFLKDKKERDGKWANKDWNWRAGDHLE